MGGIYGIAPFDALVELPLPDGTPAVFWTGDVGALLDPAVAPLLLERLRAAYDHTPEQLVPMQRVVLQNDVWGLAQRLEEASGWSSEGRALHIAAQALVMHLALPSPALAELHGTGVPHAFSGEFDDPSWGEIDTELPVLSHERVYGIRRLFRLMRNGSQRALVSQLVAIDNHGAPHLTSIVGEIEQLTSAENPDDPPISARVFELDRRAIRCDGPEAQLNEVSAIEHIPGTGANGFFVAFDEPVALSEMPCHQCHEDSRPFALPLEGTVPELRRQLLLDQLAAELP